MVTVGVEKKNELNMFYSGYHSVEKEHMVDQKHVC